MHPRVGRTRDNTHGRIRLVQRCVITLLLLAGPDVNAHGQTIDIPLRVHLVAGHTFSKQSRALPLWLTERDVREVVVPAVNRIWAPAGIRFVAQSVGPARLRSPANTRELIAAIVASHRDHAGRSDPDRIDKLDALIDYSAAPRDGIDAYIVPYLGEKSQGRAIRKQRRVFVTAWTDKYAADGAPPVRFRLTEPRPFRHGSLARTLAHELGPVLRLRHPDKTKQKTFSRLMGARKPGYGLTDHEIARATTSARKLQTRALAAGSRH